MRPGDNVIVDFEGEDHLGNIEKFESKGWVRCCIVIDPGLDYGSGTERLAPYQTVCVPSTRVRLCES